MQLYSIVSVFAIIACSFSSIWAVENIDRPVQVRHVGSYNPALRQTGVNVAQAKYRAKAPVGNVNKPSLVTPLAETTPLVVQQRQDLRNSQLRASTSSAFQRPSPQASAPAAPLPKTTPLSAGIPSTSAKLRTRPNAPAQLPSVSKPADNAAPNSQQGSATFLRPVLHSAPRQRPAYNANSASFAKGGSNGFPDGFAKGFPSFAFGGGFPGPPLELNLIKSGRSRRRVRRNFRFPFFFFRRRKDKNVKKERSTQAPPIYYSQYIRTRPRPAPPPRPPSRRVQVPFRRPPPPERLPLPHRQSQEPPVFYMSQLPPNIKSFTRPKRRPPYRAPQPKPKRPRPQYGAPPSTGYGAPPSSSYGTPASSPSSAYSSPTVGVAQTISQTNYGSTSPSYAPVAKPAAPTYAAVPKSTSDSYAAGSSVSSSSDNDFGLIIQMKFPKAALSAPTTINTPIDAYGKIDIDSLYSDTDDLTSRKKARDLKENANGFIDGKPANFPDLKTLGGFDSPLGSPKEYKYAASSDNPSQVAAPGPKPAKRYPEQPKPRPSPKEVALDHELLRAKRGPVTLQTSHGSTPIARSTPKLSPSPTRPRSINDILNSPSANVPNRVQAPSQPVCGDVTLDTSFFAKRTGNGLDVSDDEAFLEADEFQAPINATDIDDVISAASHSEDVLEVSEQRFNPSVGPFGSNGRPGPPSSPSRRPAAPPSSFSSFRPRPSPPRTPSFEDHRTGASRSKPSSRNFDVVTGGLYRDATEYRPTRPFHHDNHFDDDHSHEEEDDFFSNFRDFADINSRRRGEHSQSKNTPAWRDDVIEDAEEDEDY